MIRSGLSQKVRTEGYEGQHYYIDEARSFLSTWDSPDTLILRRGFAEKSPGYDRGLILVLCGTRECLGAAGHAQDGPSLNACSWLGIHGVVAAGLELAPAKKRTPNARAEG